jgi:uncharacterized protein YbjT (DUF2867 family)
MILVVGGTGRLGSKVTEKLLDDGTSVRVMSRTPSKAMRLADRGAEVVAGDLRDPDSIRRACVGADRVIASAHALAGKGGNDPRTVDDAGNRHLIDVALEARVGHFVFVSALGAAPEHPIEFYRIKHGIENRLRESGLSYTVLRPPAFMETWAGPIGDPIIAGGKATIFGPGRNPINFMAVDDVAHYVLLGLYHPGARNRVIEIGGPENLSPLEVAAVFERVGGRRPKRSHVPLPVMRVMSTVLRPFAPSAGRLMAVAIHLNTTDQTFDPTPILAEFPLRLTRLEELAKHRYRAAQASRTADLADQGQGSGEAPSRPRAPAP